MDAPWSDDEVEWLRECLAAGDTDADIAEMAGRTIEDVRAFIATIPDAIRRPQKRSCPPLRGFVGSIRLDELTQRYLSHETMAAIGVIAGVSRQRVDQVVGALGLKEKLKAASAPPGWLMGLPVPEGWGVRTKRRTVARAHRGRPAIVPFLPLTRRVPPALAGNVLLRQALGDVASVA